MREGVNGVRNSRTGEDLLCLATPGAWAFSKVYGEVLRHLIRPESAFHARDATPTRSRYGLLARSRVLSSWRGGHCRRTSFATAPRFAFISPEDPSCAR